MTAIEPGVEVRFADGGYLSIGPRGTAPATLVARGTEAQPIHFTADATSPSRGSWASVTFGPNAVTGVRDAEGAWVSGSVLEHCVVSYGGGDFFDDSGPSVYDFSRLQAYGEVELVASSPVVRFDTCRWSDERGLYADMSEQSMRVVISDCLFEENDAERYLNGIGGGMNPYSALNVTIEFKLISAGWVPHSQRSVRS